MNKTIITSEKELDDAYATIMKNPYRSMPPNGTQGFFTDWYWKKIVVELNGYSVKYPLLKDELLPEENKEQKKMKTTLELFDEITKDCAEIMRAKFEDYGPSFRIMRLPSHTDQLLIKARRIRSIQEKTITATGESALADWKGLVNYGFIWLVQSDCIRRNVSEIESNGIFMNRIYMLKDQCAELLKQKTADYGDAWRDMRIESITDQILMKIERMRNIETQTPETAREACVEIVKDIVNYAVFGVVKFNGVV